MRKLKLSSFSKIRLKVIFVTMLLHMVLFKFLFSAIRISSDITNKECAYAYINGIIDNDGNPVVSEELPEENTADFRAGSLIDPLFHQIYPLSHKAMRMYFSGQMHLRHFFSVKVKFDGENLKFLSIYSKDIDRKTVEDITENTFQKIIEGNREGMSDTFFWKCRSVDKKGTYLFVFLDNSLYEEYLSDLRKIRNNILFMGQFFSFFFSFVLSTWAIHMLKKEFDRQKRFLSDAGHELKTPISVISANVDVLLSSYPENKWLEYIRKETERMADLTKKMLYLARADANENKLFMTFFNLCPAITEVVLPFESVVFEQGKKLEMDLPENEVMVFGDEASVKQVAVIFLDNALKNTEQGDEIKISVSRQKNKCYLKVYNTGQGIKPSEIKKIFRRFYRSDTSRNRLTGGSGLGLSIASQIASSHNGSVYAKSEYGKYAEFTFEIPVKKFIR